MPPWKFQTLIAAPRSRKKCRLKILVTPGVDFRCGDRIAIRLLGQDGVRLEDAPAKFFEVMWVESGTETSAVGPRILLGEKLTRCKLALESGAAKNSPG